MDTRSEIDGAQLRTLLDRAAILDALAWFCERLDAGDVSAALEIFTEGCFSDYGPAAGGRLEGRPAFVERVRKSQARFRQTHHQLGQVSIELNAAERTARSIAYVTAAHRRLDGSRWDVRLQYHDDWTLIGDDWRITGRRALTALADPDDEAGKNWVPRRMPPA
jgi:hypothetical protein